MVKQSTSEHPLTVQSLGRCLSAKEASAYLGIAIKTLYNWTSMRKIASVKNGGRVGYLESDLSQWVMEHRRAAV